MKSFNWANFEAEFLKSVLYSPQTPVEKRPAHDTDDTNLLAPYMDDVAEYPNRYFFEKYRNEIEFVLLKNNPKLSVMAYNYLTGEKKIAEKMTPVEKAVTLEDLMRRPLSGGLLSAYEKVFWEVGANSVEDTFFTRFDHPVAIDLSEAKAPDIPLYQFQSDAIDALEKDLLNDAKDAGLLVMPTGSGKTRTAVYFLLSKMITAGYQVVWLTHRHMLIEQPAENFYNFSGLVKSADQNAKALRMLCVSGNHAKIRQAEKKDDILVLSVQSAVRSLDFLKRALRKKVIIVVDEAHHTVAASYRKIIDCIRRSPSREVKLLGLTATPVRINERDTAKLTNLFGNNIIYEIDTADLISQGILAEPVFERVDTEYEVIATVDQKKYIQKYGEIGPSLVDKIARSSERNKAIVDRYMADRERYGKTLIFALNVHHCITLCDDLKSLGVRCDFVYSSKNDNAHVIERFRRGELDVLVNINILTEGSDVPDIQTVFLTRPTASEVLLMQMIGRGLRGSGAGGTEKAYIVDFHDKWETFARWLTPQFVLTGEFTETEDVEVQYTYEPLYYLPFSLISDIYNSISYDYAGQPNYNIVLPYGWFSAVDDEGNDITVIVSEEQADGYSAIEKDKEVLCSNSLLTGADLQKYFSGFATPPLVCHLQAYLDNLRLDGNPPVLYLLADRKNFDPVYVAEKIKSENPTYTEMEELMEKAYADYPLAQKMFADISNYKQRVMSCLANKEPPLGAKVEELPIERIPFDRTPHHDLNQLYREVNNEMFGEQELTNRVTWTDKPYKSYFGMYYPETGEIRINKLLDSKDVPAEVIKYLIYHELLHRDYLRHDKAFREKEHMYPDYAEWDSFLDGKLLKFDLGDVWKW